MRMLAIIIFTTPLIGCSCPTPWQSTTSECTEANGSSCVDRAKTTSQNESKAATHKANSIDATKRWAETERHVISIAMRDKPNSTKRIPIPRAAPEPTATSANSSDTDISAPEPRKAAPTAGRAAVHTKDQPDPVMTKARTAVAAKLENPATAEFIEMKRAIRKNTLGQQIDTICGRVRAKIASSDETEVRPFLYLVQDDDAYVVDGGANKAAAAAYSNICN